MTDPFVLPRVKVCGLTRIEDAREALAQGAEALGFVFHPASPRCADPQVVASILGELEGPVFGVAVVVDSTPESARALLTQTGLQALQLCGRQNPEDWRGFDSPILRRIGVDERASEEIASWRGVASSFLLDHPSSAGGSGREVDLELAKKLCAQTPCLLAGGLDAARVAPAIRHVRPAGVDASSRLEDSPGIKNHVALGAFVQGALDTFRELSP